MGSVFTTVTDYVANGSFSSLKKNVKIYHTPNYAYLIRLIDASNKWKGPWIYTDKKGYIFLKKSSLKPKDILLSNVGANVGKTFLVPNLDKPMTLAPNSVLLRSSKYSNDYLFYLLNNPKNKYRLLSLVSISAQPKLNKTDFKNLQLNITNIFSEQEHLGKLINIIDHLISLQQRKVKILSNLNRAINQIIFKNHDYDNKNWKKVRIAEIFKYERPDKYIVKSENYLQQGIPVLTANKSFILGFTNERNIYDTLPVILFDDFTLESKFVDFPFMVKSSALKILSARSGFDCYFCYKLLQTLHLTVEGHSRHYISRIQPKKVYIPNYTIQLKYKSILKSIDLEIRQNKKNLFNFKKIKKFLLQNMFI